MHIAHTQKDQKVEGQGWLGVIWGFWKGSYFDYKCPWRERGEGGGNNRDNAHTFTLTQHCFVVLVTLIHGCTVGCWRCVRWPRNIITPVAPDRRERGVWRGNPVFRLLQRRSVLPMGPSSPLLIICSLLVLFQTHRVSFFCGTPNEMLERMFTYICRNWENVK